MRKVFSCLLVLMVTIILSEKLSLVSAADSECSQKQCVNETSNCLLGFPMNLSSHNINITVTFCSECIIYIEADVSIHDTTDVTLQSLENGHTDLVCTQLAVGFKVVNVSNLHISNITFDGCGLTISTKEMDNMFVLIKAGLLISHCENVTLYNITVKNSAGAGLVFNQTYGMIRITNSSFEANCKNESVLAVAGGLYIEFVHNNTDSKTIPAAVYSIDDCRFVNNWCSVPSFTDGLGSSTKYDGFGKGSGMRLVFNQKASNNNVTITNGEFSNNSALWGGGIRVHYADVPKNNSILVKGSKFVKNKSMYNGGGIDIGFAAYYSEVITPNIVEFQKCTVQENEADVYGGGIRIYSSRNNKTIPMNISFTECTLSNNKARYGPAVDMLPRSVDTYNDGFLSSVSFHACNFTSNSVTNNSRSTNSSNTVFNHYEGGKGVFFCANFFVYFSGRTIFEHNIGSAMYLSSCKIRFESGAYVYYAHNTGYDGGAIVLFGASVLYVKDNSNILFVKNTAVRRGGAIMYFSNNEHDFVALKSCFIQYLGNLTVDNRSIELQFIENKAMYGQAIFASTLRPCHRLCIHKQESNWMVYNNTSIDVSFSCIGNFTFSEDTDTKKQISTSGEGLTSKSNLLSGPIPAIPGRELTLDFSMTDELSHPTYDTFFVSVKNINGGNVSIDPGYTYVSERKVVKLYGNPGELAELILTNAEFQPIVVAAHIQMKHCPPGFVLNEGSDAQKCVCSVDTQNKTYVGITRCSSQKRRAYLRSGYYAGYNNLNGPGIEEDFITGQCPRGFCRYDLNSSYLMNEFWLPEDNSAKQLDLLVCGQERTGKLCSKCRSNHSVFFHSTNYTCKANDHTCKLSILLYFVSELLPVTILFLFVIFYDIQFTSGSLNSLLFYFQMIDALVLDVKGIVQPHIAVSSIMKANKVIYGIFNLDFFTLDKFSYCIWSKASTLDILAFKYVTIAYSLILIIITVVLMKFCNPSIIRKIFPCSREQFSVKTSIIHGLVAFLVICYTQSTEVSLSILTPGHIHWIGSANDHKRSTVVYYEGDMSFMHTQHLKYAIPAIFFLITFTIIPPLLLVVYPLCYKLFALLKLEETSFSHFLCMVVPLEKLKPLFDSFQGSFKDKYRFFAGLFFVYRLSALMLYAVTDSLTLFYTLLEIQLIVTLTLHAVVKPYKLHSHNMVDIILLGLLALINAMTMYNYQKAYRSRRNFQLEINSVTSCQVFLAFLPLICFVIYDMKKVIEKGRYYYNVLMKKENEPANRGLMDTLTMLDIRERNYSESGYHRF